MCFGNKGSLYIVVTYSPGIEAEGGAHYNITESIDQLWIALSVIVACGQAEVTFADWRWQEHVAGHRFSEQLGGQEGVWRCLAELNLCILCRNLYFYLQDSLINKCTISSFFPKNRDPGMLS